MRSLSKMVGSILATIMTVTMVFFPIPLAHAGLFDNLGQVVLGTAVEYVYLKNQFSAAHNQGRMETYKGLVQKFGHTDEPQSNEILKEAATRITNAASQVNKTATPDFRFWVNPKKEFNAFCGLGRNVSVNIGTFDKFDYNEDIIAFTVAHEVGHGLREHSLKSIDKSIPFQLAARIYATKNQNELSHLFALAMHNYLIAKNAVLPHEYEADEDAFNYAVAAGYNPGAGAAQWVRVLRQDGDNYRNFFGELLGPNDHPTNGQRVEYYSKKLTEFSENKVKVVRDAVWVNGKYFIIPGPVGKMTSEERAYFVAGNIAKAVHKNLFPNEASVDDSGRVVMGAQVIMTPNEQDGDAQEIAQKLNDCLGK